MCQTGLCRLGIAQAHYSSHRGVVTVPVSHRPHLECATYDLALKRVYPKGTARPDAAPLASAAAPAAEAAAATVAAAAAVLSATEEATSGRAREELK
jgi:hypothetical protein